MGQQLLGAQVLGLAGSPWGSPQTGLSHHLHQGARMDGVVAKQASLQSLLGNVLGAEYVLKTSSSVLIPSEGSK